MTKEKCGAFVLTLMTSHGSSGHGVVLLLLPEEETEVTSVTFDFGYLEVTFEFGYLPINILN